MLAIVPCRREEKKAKRRDETRRDETRRDETKKKTPGDTRPDHTRAEQSRPDQTRAETSRAEQSRAEQSSANQTKQWTVPWQGDGRILLRLVHSDRPPIGPCMPSWEFRSECSFFWRGGGALPGGARLPSFLFLGGGTPPSFFARER